MKLKYIGHVKQGDRYVITVEQPLFWGFKKIRKQFVDSDSYYTKHTQTTVFYNFPEMTILGASEELTVFLNGVLRKIIFDETGEIPLLGNRREK